MLIAPILTVLASCAAPLAVCETPRSTLQDERKEPFKNEFFAVLRQYENAYENYLFDLRKAQEAGKPEAEWPVHPSVTFYDQFLHLAEHGSPWGMAWLLENVQFRHPKRDDQIRENKRWHEKLIREWPNHDSLLRATRLMPTAANALGREYVLSLLDELAALTTRADLKGNVLWAQATTLNLEGSSAEDQASAAVLYEQLVQSYAESPLARDAAIILYPRLQSALQRELSEWVAKVESLGTEQADDWPACPLIKHAERMRPLAATGILQARQWVDEFFANWSSAQKDHVGKAMLVLSDQCGVFQGAVTGPWADLMIRIRSLVVARWAGEEWLQSDYESFVQVCFVRTYSAETLAPYFATLQGAAKTELEAATGAFGRAFLFARGASLADLVAAHEAFAGVLADHPDSVWSALAEREHRSLGKVLPGAVLELQGRAPTGALVDVNQFRGSVVLIDFFSFSSDACDERLRQEAEYAAAKERQGLVVLGVCTDSLVGKSFELRAEEHGVTWPCISDLSVRTQLALRWHVRRFPTSMVLDREGVLVDRNGSWDSTRAVLDRLLAD